ncbi:MAG: PKD domain-containing protein [Bacteroidales bacterium]|nr:PKD domain-containing protein [Bacteroidales bacterium]
MKKFYFLFLLLNYVSYTKGEEFRTIWSARLKNLRAIIENKGQENNIANNKILYSYYGGGKEKFHFTSNGLIIEIDTIIIKKNPLAKLFNSENYEEYEKENMKIKKTYIFCLWQNSNPNLTIIPINETEGYYTFRQHSHICKGYKALIYKNIYPYIDIIYYIPQGDSAGIKYNIILHKNADFKDLSLKYSGDFNEIFKDSKGNIIIKNDIHNIIDHAPIINDNYNCEFILKDNIVSFNLELPDSFEKIIIDPWVAGINYGEDLGYDVDYDFDLNLYVYSRANGGSLYVSKYSNTGTLLWTHIVTTDNTYDGNFMIDRLANKLYISEGFNANGARAYRLDLNGIADGFISQQNGNFREMWDMIFDCKMNRIIGVGGGTSSNLNGGLINPNTGAVSVANFTGFSGTCQDIVSGAVDNQGRVFVVFAKSTDETAVDDKLLLVNNTLNGYVWMVTHGMYGFSECSQHSLFGSWCGPQNSNAFNALDVNDYYLYYYDGQGLAVYNKNNGNQIFATSVGYSGTWYQPLQQGGIAVDDCNNIYLGGPNNLLHYYFNGSNVTAPVNIPINWPGTFVWDVKYDRNSNLLFISGYEGVAVMYANQSASCINNDINTNVTCLGNQTGNITVTVNTNITSPTFNYYLLNQSGNVINQNLNSSSNTYTFNSVSNGTYIIKVQINPLCGPILFDTLVVDCPNCGGNVTTNNVLCYGQNNGSAVLTITEGQAPFTINWSNGSHGTSVTDLSAGNYSVTIIDANGCSAAIPFTINQPPQLSISSNSTNVTCYGGNDGSAFIQVNGGTPPYSFSWSNGLNSSTASNLSAGNYIITVTDNNGCTITTSINITQPAPLNITAIATPSNICPNQNSTLTANGAVSYSWSHGLGSGNNINVSPSSTTTYLVTGTDNNGCTATSSVTVTVFTPPTISISGNNNICQGEIATLTANGGISYIWDIGPNQQTIQVQPSTTSTYIVTGTDANGCTNTASFQVNVIPYPIPNAGNDTSICGLTTNLNATPSIGTGMWSSLQTNVIIANPSDPHSQVTVPSTGQYIFIWTENNNGCIKKDTVKINFTKIPTSNFTATPILCFGDVSIVNFTGVADGQPTFTWTWDGGYVIPGTGPGPHQVSWSTSGSHTISLVVTVNNCHSTVTSITLTNPDSLSLSLSKTDVACFGQNNGSINVTVSGGTPPYNFQWNNGSTLEDLSNISAGIYLVTVTDANGCTTFSGIEIKQPPKLTGTINPSQFICIGQPAYLNLAASGGTPPYTYFWNGQTSNPTTVVFPDTTTIYSGQIIDANGCSTDVMYTTVYVAPPIQTNLLANTTKVCPGDPIMLTPVIWGGIGPPYLIYNQEGEVVTPPIIINPQESGQYWILVEDACGTKDTASVFIETYPIPPINIFADTLQGCAPLTVQFNETSPDSGQSYIWNFGDDSNLSLGKNPIHTYWQGGTYDISITVTSKEGCKFTKTYNDFIKVWPQPYAAFKWEPESVNEINSEVQFINLSNGAVMYIWDFGDGDSSNIKNPIHRYKSSGDYLVSLIAISIKGCMDTAKGILKVLEQYTFYAPTAFSPDGDKVNDFFYVVAHGIKEEGFSLQIFDRWGELIWETDKFYIEKERSEKWDGTAKNNKVVPVGTYVWKAKFKDKKGSEHEVCGKVTVIR